jgi:hypothetical protein
MFLCELTVLAQNHTTKMISYIYLKCFLVFRKKRIWLSMNKKLKTILIVLITLVVGYFLLNYAMLKMGEHLFKTEVINAEEIAGKTDNNAYGIRNDVFDVIQKEYVEKMSLNEEQKILVYNLSFLEQSMISNLSDKDLILKNIEMSFFIIDCEMGKNVDLLNKFVEPSGVYRKALINSESRKLANLMVERIYSKNSDQVSQFMKDKNECVKFKRFIKE